TTLLSTSSRSISTPATGSPGFSLFCFTSCASERGSSASPSLTKEGNRSRGPESRSGKVLRPDRQPASLPRNSVTRVRPRHGGQLRPPRLQAEYSVLASGGRPFRTGSEWSIRHVLAV